MYKRRFHRQNPAVAEIFYPALHGDERLDVDVIAAIDINKAPCNETSFPVLSAASMQPRCSLVSFKYHSR